jgi:hypothetical protein
LMGASGFAMAGSFRFSAAGVKLDG